MSAQALTALKNLHWAGLQVATLSWRSRIVKWGHESSLLLLHYRHTHKNPFNYKFNFLYMESLFINPTLEGYRQKAMRAAHIFTSPMATRAISLAVYGVEFLLASMAGVPIAMEATLFFGLMAVYSWSIVMSRRAHIQEQAVENEYQKLKDVVQAQNLIPFNEGKKDSEEAKRRDSACKELNKRSASQSQLLIWGPEMFFEAVVFYYFGHPQVAAKIFITALIAWPKIYYAGLNSAVRKGEIEVHTKEIMDACKKQKSKSDSKSELVGNDDKKRAYDDAQIGWIDYIKTTQCGLYDPVAVSK